MKEVSFRRLALTGFGPYRDKVEVRLKDSVNTLIAPNERGKSSLVMGLLATIFGLPARTDPAAFGQARFRNWDNPPRFEGEVEFEADGAVYRIRRDFSTHRVSLARLENGKYVSLISGEHNPGATRKPNVTYEKKLAEIFSMTSRDLFESTFCVKQPVPEAKQLDRNVQELLSGAGAGFAQALSSLVEELSTQTKATRDRGVTSHNQTNDRRLEKLCSRIAALQAEIESARHAVDSLQAVLKRLADVERDLDEARRVLKSKESILNAWSEWRRLAAEYRQALKEQSGLGSALDESRRLVAQIDLEAGNIQETYPEFEGAPDDIESRLADLISIREKLAEAARGISDVENAVKSKQAELERLTVELRTLRNWGDLGPGPEAAVRSMKRRAAELLQRWRDFTAGRRELAACEAKLSEKFSVFDEASPDELRLAESYSARLAELERDMDRARHELEAMDERIKAFERDRQDFDRRHAEIAAFGPGAADTLRRKLDALRRERDLKAALAERERLLVAPQGARAAAGLASALVAGIIAWLAWGRTAGPQGMWVSLDAAVLLGLAAYVASGALHARKVSATRLEARRLESELATCRQELASLGQAVAGAASSDEAALGALCAKAEQRDEEMRTLTAKKALLPTEEERKQAGEAFERARQERETFVKVTDKFSRRFQDVEAAFFEWKDAVEKKSRLETFIRDFAHESFGCAPEIVADASPAAPDVSDAWREVAEFVSVASSPGDARTVGDLVAFLEECDTSWWERATTEAAEYEKIARAIQAAHAAIEAGTGQIGTRRVRHGEFEAKDQAASRLLEIVLKASNGDPIEARRRWSERRGRIEKLERMRASFTTLLKQHGASSVDDLREKKTDADNNAAQALSDWKRLVNQNPGLPEVDEADGVERIEARWRSLNNDVTALRDQVAGIEKERGDLSAEQGRLAGQTPVNIAQAEVELAAHKRQREEVELLADALTVACVELAGAVTDFQESHRGRLQDAATEHFRRITGVGGRAVVIDDDFRVHIDDGGMPCDPAQLSKGAQDQLYIALRLAIADLLAEDHCLPFIFDDPFASCDSARLANLGASLKQMAGDRQILVLSHIEDLSSWGAPAEVQQT